MFFCAEALTFCLLIATMPFDAVPSQARG